MSADEHRSTPGFVYGVGVYSSHFKPAEYSCACPCHKAGPENRSAYCNVCHRGSIGTSPRTSTHEQAIESGARDPYPWQQPVPDYYYITRGNTLTDELGEHFTTAEEADQRADQLNAAAVLEALQLPTEALVRRERLRALGETFGVRYGEGHPESRWPTNPGRYAVEVWSERYSESFWETCETLDEVRAEIVGGEVNRVVDLDADRELSFTVTVEVPA